MLRSLTASIVRFFTAQDEVVGTGFLVSTKYIVTCAHVVNQALERDEESVEQPIDEKVSLDFPCSFPQRKYAAHVVSWHPPQPLLSLYVMSVRDIAILELDRLLLMMPGRLSSCHLSQENEQDIISIPMAFLMATIREYLPLAYCGRRN